MPWLPVLFIIFPVTHWPVPESVCLIQFWKTFFGWSVQYSPIVILPSCRSISFLPDYFLSLGLFPVLHSVSSPSVCYVSIRQYYACLSVILPVFYSSDCFLTVGLFPVQQSVPEPSVRFLSFASAWHACRPVSCSLVFFQFFGLSPVHQNQSVSYSSVSFKFIDVYLSISLFSCIGLSPVHWSILFMPACLILSVRLFTHTSVGVWSIGLFPVCHSDSYIYLPVCVLSFHLLCCLFVCWYTVFPVNCLYPVLEFLNNLWGLGTDRNRIVVSARQATQPDGIGSLELILGLFKSLKIRALVSCLSFYFLVPVCWNSSNHFTNIPVPSNLSFMLLVPPACLFVCQKYGPDVSCIVEVNYLDASFTINMPLRISLFLDFVFHLYQ